MREIISKEKEKNKSKECVTKKRMRPGCEWTTCSMAYQKIFYDRSTFSAAF